MNNGELLTWIIFHANWKHCITIGWLWLNGIWFSAELSIKYHSRKEIIESKAVRTKLLWKISSGRWTTRSLFLEVSFTRDSVPRKHAWKARAKEKPWIFQTWRSLQIQWMNLNICTRFTFIPHLGASRIMTDAFASILIKYIVSFNIGSREAT